MCKCLTGCSKNYCSCFKGKKKCDGCGCKNCSNKIVVININQIIPTNKGLLGDQKIISNGPLPTNSNSKSSNNSNISTTITNDSAGNNKITPKLAEKIKTPPNNNVITILAEQIFTPPNKELLNDQKIISNVPLFTNSNSLSSNNNANISTTIIKDSVGNNKVIPKLVQQIITPPNKGLLNDQKIISSNPLLANSNSLSSYNNVNISTNDSAGNNYVITKLAEQIFTPPNKELLNDQKIISNVPLFTNSNGLSSNNNVNISTTITNDSAGNNKVTPKLAEQKIKPPTSNDKQNQKISIAIPKRTPKGSIYDHFTIQGCSSQETYMCISDNDNIDSVKKEMSQTVRDYTYYLDFHEIFDVNVRIPKILMKESFNCGLLIIPGRSNREFSDEKEKGSNAFHRKNLENKLIRNALLRGQPTLAICAGVLRLFTYIYNHCNYNTVDSNVPLIPKEECFLKTGVKNHCARKMMSLSLTKRKVNNKKDVSHGLVVEENSMFASLIYKKESPKKYEPKEIKVNSVHNFGLNTEYFRNIRSLEVTGMSKNDNNKNSEKDVPEVYIYNGIFVGVLYHPEAFGLSTLDDEKHNLILFKSMVQAGLQYQNKRLMLEEIHNKKNLLIKV
ncbi:hypothetical protein ACTFIV_002432 [Dictyostelium citrinum]